MSAPTVTDPRTGKALPPFLPLNRAAALCGKSKRWMKALCESGAIPALQHDAYAHWSIPTAPLLRFMGIEPEIAPSRQSAVADPTPPGVAANASASGEDPGEGEHGSALSPSGPSTRKGRAA